MDISKLATQSWDYSGLEGTEVNCNVGSYSSWEFLTPTLFKINSPTGRFQIQQGIHFREGGYDTCWMKVQLGIYTSDPSGQGGTNILPNLLNSRGYFEASTTTGSNPLNVMNAGFWNLAANTDYWIRPFWASKAIVVQSVIPIDNYWVTIAPK